MQSGISVIVPVYNRPVTVLDALDSVAAQSMPPDRLIVVDDGSTDGTRQAIENWAGRHSHRIAVNLISQTNGGASRARNHALTAAADATFIAFLDSDDLWPPDFLERTLLALRQSPTAVAASCDQVYVSERGERMRFESVREIESNATRWLYENTCGVGCCSLFRAEPLRRLGGFDERLQTGEDTDLYLRLSLLGAWRYVAGTPVTIRPDVGLARGEAISTSRSRPDRYRRWAQIREDFVQRHGGRRHLPTRVFKARLARDWLMAGQDYLDAGRISDARDCLRRAVAWQPTNGKAWRRLAKAYLFRTA